VLSIYAIFRASGAAAPRKGTDDGGGISTPRRPRRAGVPCPLALGPSGRRSLQSAFEKEWGTSPAVSREVLWPVGHEPPNANGVTKPAKPRPSGSRVLGAPLRIRTSDLWLRRPSRSARFAWERRGSVVSVSRSCPGGQRADSLALRGAFPKSADSNRKHSPAERGDQRAQSAPGQVGPYVRFGFSPRRFRRSSTATGFSSTLTPRACASATPGNDRAWPVRNKI
jgi:hypothetical protein